MQRRELVKPREEDPVLKASLPWRRRRCWKQARASTSLLASEVAALRRAGAGSGQGRQCDDVWRSGAGLVAWRVAAGRAVHRTRGHLASRGQGSREAGQQGSRAAGRVGRGGDDEDDDEGATRRDETRRDDSGPWASGRAAAGRHRTGWALGAGGAGWATVEGQMQASKQERDHRRTVETGDWRPETGGWRLEAAVGVARLEAGVGVAGSRSLDSGRRQRGPPGGGDANSNLRASCQGE
ncbi:hypothetical protein P171DRAFT_484663 [Karstenula rhodostoma CBS 690.94]|uniref:Uncharacterized protein n=1 Tax=Karstenula rhodostoma CBS 690.94 TaxID=1392251 RepID=A0A9P4PL26_9PLEO|nr:hypothetical protein P171DRAFT_484663 [Karstenula rhodostoma CBS 690.94]